MFLELGLSEALPGNAYISKISIFYSAYMQTEYKRQASPTDEWRKGKSGIVGSVAGLYTSVKRSIATDLGKKASLLSPAYMRTRQLRALHHGAQNARLANNWEDSPKAVLEGFAAEVPGRIKILSADKADQASHYKSSKFELFFLSRIPELPNFLDRREAGSFSVMECITCLSDTIRTKKFLLGIKSSISELEKGRDEIHVYDAGSGAVPILAVYAALASPKVRCTCIELNSNSVEMARRIIASIGLENRIRVIRGDAITHKPDGPIDLLVSETMSTALIEEPIVDIMANLAKYVKEDGIKLPNAVAVKASLLPSECIYAPQGYVKIYSNLALAYFDTDWKAIAHYRPGDNLERISFSFSPEEIAAKGKSRSYYVLLASEVAIHDQHLELYESMITMPIIFGEPEHRINLFGYRKDQGRHKLFFPEEEPISGQYKPGEPYGKILRS